MTDNEKISILQNLIQIPSVNDHEEKVADYIISLFEPYSDKVQIKKVPFATGRTNLVITMGNPSGKHLGFSGHMDVVDPGNLDHWEHDPFAGVVDEKADKLFGRGASDMKSGLAAAIIIMLEMLESGTSIEGQIKLLATVGEETGEYGAHVLTQQGYADDLDGLIITEPHMDGIITSCKGVIDYQVTSVGVPAHSSRPDEGVNAIDNLMQFYLAAQKLMSQHTEVNAKLGKMTHSIDIIEGGKQVNSVPDYAMLKGNIRSIPEYSNEQIFTDLQQVVDDLNASDPKMKLAIKFIYPEVPIVNGENSLTKLAQKVSGKYFDKILPVESSSGANDGSEFVQAKKDFPIILVGPGNGSSHGYDEYVDISQYLTSIAYLKDVASQFVGVLASV
ncbi:Acetylornithine deacetylase [Pediococcus damnosus]|uniref:Probable succinyl-diaminopimelate desuccinylase n=1 Tax=Pediococcus damnosus TaxID=51663 RepID=A0AAC9B275_9LACO|nr:ArgE/DapE family deacylase [Pediococcus damnosus]AMV62905.1 Acetylornithine deacetylase [Pediococcus damnosus]AMV64952.1 Acetylornithine deacetylase [Pediococcus damnosus]AMV67211.1 Acetylornithine deacetylase [Pediococcus damnosus]AMV69757.1 Acetylornithine deacetylase [Pediococcus damnosus]KJU74142.1 succinyl-diaminopimelate desuccinylase [Pediococcus damnosus LMG 28219]